MGHLNGKRATFQYLDCYEDFNYYGDSVHLVGYADDLGDYNFNNRARSCCAFGM